MIKIISEKRVSIAILVWYLIIDYLIYFHLIRPEDSWFEIISLLIFGPLIWGCALLTVLSLVYMAWFFSKRLFEKKDRI